MFCSRYDEDRERDMALQRAHSMEELAAVLLRGEAADWPSDGARAEPERFLRMAAVHGVSSLLAYQLRRTHRWHQWPVSITARLHQAVRVDVALEVVRRVELERVVLAMSGAGVRPLLMKGAALAYLHYPEPSLRPRYDTDLLVHPDDRDAVAETMRELGYRRAAQTSGDFVMPQANFEMRDRFGTCHVCDVHWKIATPQPFANLLPIDALRIRAVEVPTLGTWARALGNLDALLLACIHRVAHHDESTRLLWLYDIHLIASGLDRQAFARFTALATATGMRAICARGLGLARARFHTTIPEEAMAALAAPGAPEPAEMFLRSDRRKIDVLISDLRLVGSWSARRALLRQHLFPPAP